MFYSYFQTNTTIRYKHTAPYVDNKNIQDPIEKEPHFITRKIGWNAQQIIVAVHLLLPITTQEEIKIRLSLAVTGAIKEINDTDRTFTIKTKEFVKKPTEFKIIAHVPNNPQYKKTFDIFRPEKNVFITGSISAAENGKFGMILDKINYAPDHAELIPSKQTNTPWYAEDDELKKAKPEEHDAAN